MQHHNLTADLTLFCWKSIQAMLCGIFLNRYV